MPKVYLKGINASDGGPRVQEMKVKSYDDLTSFNSFARDKAVAELVSKAKGFKGAIRVLTHQPERGKDLAWEQCGWPYTVEQAKEKLNEPAYYRATYQIDGETRRLYAPREHMNEHVFNRMAFECVSRESGVDVGVIVDYVEKPE